MSNRTAILLSMWLILLGIAIILDDIRDQLRGCKIVYLSRESSGDAAALSAARLADPGGDK